MPKGTETAWMKLVKDLKSKHKDKSLKDVLKIASTMYKKAK